MATKKKVDQRKFNKGRAPLSDHEESVKYSFRMTPIQRENLDEVGGAPFLREAIEEAAKKLGLTSN